MRLPSRGSARGTDWAVAIPQRENGKWGRRPDIPPWFASCQGWISSTVFGLSCWTLSVLVRSSGGSAYELRAN